MQGTRAEDDENVVSFLLYHPMEVITRIRKITQMYASPSLPLHPGLALCFTWR